MLLGWWERSKLHGPIMRQGGKIGVDLLWSDLLLMRSSGVNVCVLKIMIESDN